MLDRVTVTALIRMLTQSTASSSVTRPKAKTVTNRLIIVLQLKAELNNNKWVCMLVEQNHKLHMLCHQVLTMVRFLQTDKSLDNQLQTRIKPLMQVESSISNTAA